MHLTYKYTFLNRVWNTACVSQLFNTGVIKSEQVGRNEKSPPGKSLTFPRNLLVSAKSFLFIISWKCSPHCIFEKIQQIVIPDNILHMVTNVEQNMTTISSYSHCTPELWCFTWCCWIFSKRGNKWDIWLLTKTTATKCNCQLAFYHGFHRIKRKKALMSNIW